MCLPNSSLPPRKLPGVFYVLPCLPLELLNLFNSATATPYCAQVVNSLRPSADSIPQTQPSSRTSSINQPSLLMRLEKN
ncbi:hypothetical protein M434DRAFT_330918 [Hypoxylon sp. CO27-5]|nr:hypothetical protein M434DRAFT_330918 [Hypoxylon sp. CO27-5]